LSEIQEPHPQPPPRKRGGGYDLLETAILKRDIVCCISIYIITIFGENMS